MVFARQVDGQELTFGVSGKLIMNAVVLYDHQTDTLWSQFLSQAVDGPLAGTKLDLLPSTLTTWSAWRNEHPDTLLLDRSKGLFSGGPDHYASYYRSQQAGILGEANKDRRLPVKELVVGLDTGITKRAYAFTDLAESPVINDTYEDKHIVVTFDPGADASAVFLREVGNQVLTFSPDGPAKMRDTETGSTWSVTAGRATGGPMKGKQLISHKSFVAFWFAWSDFYPETEVYRSP